MEITGLRALVRSVSFDSPLAVPATILPTVGPSVDTRVIWLDSSDRVPPGNDLQRVERRRVAAIRSDDAPIVARGTEIEIVLADGFLERWKVDGIERVEPDHVRAVMVPA